MASMKALVTVEGGKAEIKEVPIPEPLPGHALIKVNAVAQSNDLNGIEVAPSGVTCGDDFAGVVIEPNGTGLEKGQRVAGFVMGSEVNPSRGTFAQYCMAHPDYVFNIPESISDTAAASIGLSMATATVSLKWLDLPDASDSVKEPFPVFIYGASSSVGLFATQLCKLAGLFVIATASKKNHELVKSHGADVIIDYRDEDWIDQVKNAAHNKIHHVFDTISTVETARAAVQTLSSEGGRIVCIMARTPEELELPENIKLNVALCYTVFGEDLGAKNHSLYSKFQDTDGARPQDAETWKKYLRLLPGWLETGLLKPNPLWEYGGIEDILEGLTLQRNQGKAFSNMALHFPADQVGSLIRPFFLLETRKGLGFNSHTISHEQFAGTKETITLAVQKQLEMSIHPITSGESERTDPFCGFFEKLQDMQVSHYFATSHDFQTQILTIEALKKSGTKYFSALQATGKIIHIPSAYLPRWKLLKGVVHLEHIEECKITIPSITWQYFKLAQSLAYAPGAYQSGWDYLSGLALAFQWETKTLYDAGSRSVQVDDSHLTYLS
ncbi:zinc-binding dehydrogenase [Paramyrothecium foliicola]|nr:zinc-binding dehydrogenase [Paramyrothecium foliicola]